MDHTFAVPGVGQDIASGADDQAATIINEMRIFAAPVDPSHVGLVLDGPRLQKSDPVLNTPHGPVGDDGQQLRAPLGGDSKMFRKPKVITYEGRHDETAPPKVDDLVARRIMFCFASEGKRLQLAVAGDLDSIGREGNGLVASLAMGSGSHKPTENEGLQALGRPC